jgi:hypothetical protein
VRRFDTFYAGNGTRNPHRPTAYLDSSKTTPPKRQRTDTAKNVTECRTAMRTLAGSQSERYFDDVALSSYGFGTQTFTPGWIQHRKTLSLSLATLTPRRFSRQRCRFNHALLLQTCSKVAVIPNVGSTRGRTATTTTKQENYVNHSKQPKKTFTYQGPLH